MTTAGSQTGYSTGNDLSYQGPDENTSTATAVGAEPGQGQSRALATFVSSLMFDDIPDEVIARMRTSMLDSIGCCLYGATLPWTRHVSDMVDLEESVKQVSIWGTDRWTSLSNAVLVNSTAGHAFELDDIHKESIIHAGSIATPIVLGYAQLARTGLSPTVGDKKRAKSVSGQDVLTGMVAGYELGTRVGNAATMDLFFRGFHPQGTSGVFVAAACAARMMNLDTEQTLHALGIVGSQAGGLMAAQEGAMVKRFHSGRAAQSGVYSALLAARGFTGIEDVLEAPYGGYLNSYSSKPNYSRLLDGLGVQWETAKVGYKPHACVTSIHSALDAFAHLLQTHSIAPDQIREVRIGVSQMTHTHCAWEYRAQGVTAAQMNLYYGIAVTALDGMAFVAQYDQSRITDPAIMNFIQKIQASVDPEIDAMGPGYRHAARVQIDLTDGRTVHHEILNRRGSPENPLSHDEVVYKFRHVVGGILNSSTIDEYIRLTETIDKAQTVEPLLALLARPL